MLSTSLLYMVSFFQQRFFSISSHTKKPSPPMMTSAAVVSSTTGSSANPERLEKAPVSIPCKSNPALQKAETE